MSGPFGSSQWMYASGGFYPYQIEQSLRFNDNDSAYLSRTPAGSGNRKTWTWSGWVKRGNITSEQVILGINSASTNIFTLAFLPGDTLRVFNRNSGVDVLNITTSALHRDVSAWYHIVVVIDTTQATAADRARLYVNGVEVTAFGTATYPTQNTDLVWNSSSYAHDIGRESTGSYFDGYMAEVNFIDGTALDPTSFGETKSGIWIPKAYSGSYGTNGFYLSFADSAAIGDDLSGNGNDWTANNLVATDVLLDSPTNNFAVLDQIRQGRTSVLSEGNLRSSGNDQGNFPIPTTGKWYWEIDIQSSNGFTAVGFTNGPYSQYLRWNVAGGSWTNASAGTLNIGSQTGQVNCIVIMAFDADNGEFWMGVNGTWFASGDPAANTNSTLTLATSTTGIWIPEHNLFSGGVATLNFGQDSSFAGNKTRQGNADANGVGDFYYAPPSGFLALCTANLPDPVIDPAQDDVPADYFNTVLYSGNNGTQSITGVGFSPDWLWIKVRNEVNSHYLFDQIRGADQALFSDSTSNEIDYSATGRMTSFDSDGFTVEYSSSTGTNASGDTYVAWNWLAGNGTASNTDGSITSTVSVNQKAGFSVVSYTGNGATDASVGHGLGIAPSFFIVKNRTTSTNWPVYHKSLPAHDGGNYPTNSLRLNTTGALANTLGLWGAPTSSVFTISDGQTSAGDRPLTNTNGDNYIAYCFAEVEGYSKISSYTGNGSTDGPFVYCGFRPAFVMVKNSSTTGSWRMYDTKRPDYNPEADTLYAEGSYAEDNTSERIDILSNGFKLRNSATNNGSGVTVIFMAFAESPFKYANAR
jgi:hypothetical protein